MKNIKILLESVLEEVRKVGKKYDFEKEFDGKKIKKDIKKSKLSKESVNTLIEKEFHTKISEIKENILEKKDFLKKFKEMYNKTFNLIMGKIK